MKTKILSTDGLFGLSILLSILIFTLSMIGGDGSFLDAVARYFNAIALSNENSGIFSAPIYAIGSFFETLAYFLSQIGSENLSSYFFQVFGTDSMTGINLFSDTNSQKINALLTFVPTIFISLLLITRGLPLLILSLIPKKKAIKIKPVKKMKLKIKKEKVVKEDEYKIDFKSKVALKIIETLPVLYKITLSIISTVLVYSLYVVTETIYFIGEKTGLENYINNLLKEVSEA